MTINNKLKKINLAKELSNYNYNTNNSRIFSINEFTGKYNCLNFGNGSSWCHKSNLKNHKLATMKKNGKILFSWVATIYEQQDITNEFYKNCIIEKYGNNIKYIKFCGLKDYYIYRPIKSTIKKYYKKQPCCFCGKFYNLICDHKNDLYNDPRVLNLKTQTLNDFQSLCNQCNLLKRQVNIITKLTGKRYKATKIPILKNFNIDFIIGDENFDIDDVNALKGTFWYDPIEFMKNIKK